jgi:hypothetical protein
MEQITNEELIAELLKRQANNEINADHICEITRCVRIEYLEVCLEEMDSEQLKAFERTFDKIKERQAKKEEADYESHQDYKETLESLDKIFRI